MATKAVPIKSNATEAKIPVLVLGFKSSVFIKTEVKVELITNATNNEDESTIIKVIGKNFMNCPIIPGHNAKGTKAAKVVAVDAIIGMATSPTPYFAASLRDIPSSIKR